MIYVKWVNELNNVFNLQINDRYAVTHVIVPDQTGDGHSCQMTDSGHQNLVEILQQYDLIQIGWIHVCTMFIVL